jgi:hypothetical protein
MDGFMITPVFAKAVPTRLRCADVFFFLYFKTIDQFSTGIENAEMSYMAIFAKVLRHK